MPTPPAPIPDGYRLLGGYLDALTNPSMPLPLRTLREAEVEEAMSGVGSPRMQWWFSALIRWCLERLPPDDPVARRAVRSGASVYPEGDLVDGVLEGLERSRSWEASRWEQRLDDTARSIIFEASRSVAAGALAAKQLPVEERFEVPHAALDYLLQRLMAYAGRPPQVWSLTDLMLDDPLTDLVIFKRISKATEPLPVGLYAATQALRSGDDIPPF